MYWREIPGIVFFFLLLLFNLSAKLHAQYIPDADSLKNLVNQSSGEQKVELLHKLSDRIQRSDINSALNFGNKALNLSEQLGEEKLLAESHRKLGRMLSLDGQHPDGLEHLLKAKELYEALSNAQKNALATENLGALYRRQNNYQKSLKYYYKAFNLREKLNNQEGLSNTLLNIGLIHERLNQPEKSAEFYKQALHISKNKQDYSRIAITATQLGNLYADNGNMDEGIKFMQQALEASEQLPGEHARASILLNISTIYNSNESSRMALEANREALVLADRLQSESLKIWAQKNMAEIHENLNEFQIARQYLTQALTFLENGGSAQQILNTRNHLARNYLDTEDFELAAIEAQKSLEEATSVKAFTAGIESLQILIEVFKQTDDVENIVRAQEQLMALKDSVYNRKQAQKIAEMQTRFHTEQKEQEIALLQEEAEQDRLFRHALMIGLILIVIISILIYNRQKLKIRKKRVELENTRLKEKQLESDLAFKNRELTNHSLHLVQKNEAMKDLKNNIVEIQQNGRNDLGKKLQKLQNTVNYSLNLDEDWKQFQHYFEEVHSGFFDTLKSEYPDLTPNELRLSALAKLNLSIKETATIMGITPNSVKTARYRLRKKLEMETEENLTEFMMEVEKKKLR